MKVLAFLMSILAVASSWTMLPCSSASFRLGQQLQMSSSSSSSADASTEYSVTLGLPPLGIVFEDIGAGYPPKGVQVVALAGGGKGANCGKIEIGDVLKSCSAVKFLSGSSKYEILEVDCTALDFDTVVSAITSNDEKFGCDSVTLTFTRPSKKQKEVVSTEEQSKEEK